MCARRKWNANSAKRVSDSKRKPLRRQISSRLRSKRSSNDSSSKLYASSNSSNNKKMRTMSSSRRWR